MRVRGLLSGIVVVLCVAGCGALLWSVPALAEPLARPGVRAEWVSNVASDSATLGAQINPTGVDTTYYFQYGTVSCTSSPSSCTDVPVPPGSDMGSEFGVQTVSAHLQGLQPGTVYHYRVLATNALGTVEGPDQTFTTQALGGALKLPDGRQWELVSPVEKLGAQVIPINNALIQASEDGSAISYYLSAPFVANPSANVKLAQAFSRRGPGGWSTEDIATPHDGAVLSGNGRTGEYMFFSPDLSHGLVEPFGETRLSPETTEETPYVRDNATGSYTPLVTPANVPPGTKFGDEKEGFEEALEFVTASRDLSHVVLRSVYALTANAQANGHSLYYEWTAGRLQLITALPLEGGEFQIGFNNNMRRAVSNDGSRVFWRTSSPSHLYMTDMTDGEVLRVDKAQGVAEPSTGDAAFQIASGDGSLVFFTDSQQLTASPGGGLYVYDVATGKLTLVTVARNGGEEPGDQRLVLGAAEDGSYVYLVAKGVLSEAPNAEQEKAVAGGNNLYVLHREAHGSTEEWKPSFIAALSAGDENDWKPRIYGTYYVPGGQTVEVSRNGRYVAFMSDRSLTGYDNRDASSGEPDEEVYLYDAAGARLVCASCNPTGARPSGWQEPQASPLSDLAEAWRGRWVAATIPGITETTGQRNLAPHEPAYLSDSGRLFFDSRDALVAQDVNGVGDAYQYEPGGVGSCATANGCVALLSGGAGPDESAFVDASVSGSDVFFVTTDRLAPRDVGTAYDMYDAHMCSAEAPCSSSVVGSPSCATADACKGPLASQPGMFGAPASATFSGAGNVAPSPAVKARPRSKSKGCKKGYVRKRGKCAKKRAKKADKSSVRFERGRR